MDFDREIEMLKNRERELEKDIANLSKKYSTAKDFTSKLLAECKAAGITKISISRNHESIDTTQGWPFNYEGSLFTPNGVCDSSGWPAIWGVANSLGLKGGCGNGGQTQRDTSRLVDGVYHLKNSKWIKVD